MTENIFELIARGDAPSHTVYEDEHVRAFLDINPKTRGHTLVIPKRTSTNILDISVLDFQHVMMTTYKLASNIKEAMQADGVNIIHSAEKAAQQDVPYFHVHIVPRYTYDTLNIWAHKPANMEEELEQVKDIIVNALEHE